MISAHPGLKRVVGQVLDFVGPPPDRSPSQWADANRQISPEGGAEPGKWDTSRAEYQRGIMDAFHDPTVETIVGMTSAQVGKTEIVLNIIGTMMDDDPCPMMAILPTLDMAEGFSKERLAPMLRDTPSLKDKVNDKKKGSGNTLLNKSFPGGQITLAGANSPASLSSRPLRVVLFDEVDRFPVSAGNEGDPVNLGKARAANFWNRKFAMFSTPTIKRASRIEAAWEWSDKRRFFVPCPDCGEEQHLQWSRVIWPEGQPEEARYFCEHCGSGWDEQARHDAVSKGHWVATAEFKGFAGFHLNQLYSPWRTLQKIVSEFLEAKKLPETLKTWVNLTLGETYEEESEGIEPDALIHRCEEYSEVPEAALILTAGVDVQKDRLECEVVAWSPEQESWSMDYRVFYGNPAKDELWEDLDAYLKQRWPHASGHSLPIAGVCVDSGGHYTQQVYQFTKPRERRRIFAIKGNSHPGTAIVGKPSARNKYRAKLFPLGVDTAKEVIYSRLEIDEHGPGYCHFRSDLHDEAYFQGLTAERVVTKYKRGFAHRVWIKPSGVANEPLDCRVYALAALLIANPQWGKLKKAMSEKVKAEKPKDREPEKPPLTQREMREAMITPPEEPAEKPKKKVKRKVKRRRSGFVHNW